MPHQLKEAVELMSEGKATLAEQKLTAILTQRPDDEQILSLLGHSLLAQKKELEAIRIFQKLVSTHPRSDSAWVELATAFISLRQFNEAASAFEKSLKLNPNQSEAWLFLGNIAMQKGNRDYAKHCFKQSEVNDPFKAQMEMIFEKMKNQHFAAAEKQCRSIIQHHASHPAALYVLAQLANQVLAYEEAVKILSKGLNHSPYNVKLLEALAKAYASLARFDRAIETAKKLLLVQPENPDFWILLGGELANMARNEESVEAYRKAIELAPGNPSSYLKLGHQLRITGDRDACERVYQQALDIGGINGAIYWAKADLKAYRFNAIELKEMEEFFNNKENIPVQRCQVGFAIAKSYEDNQNFSAAFNFYELANSLKPENTFDPLEYRQVCDNIRSAFNAESLRVQAKHPTGPTPIFIVGLPRSGSTLTEQILGSHSQIEGTMELFQLPNLVRRINILGGKRAKQRFPESINLFNAEELTAFGQSYLDETAIFRSDKPFFIDKLPPNFHQIGLIHKVLPQAIIIDARRHPMSVGFSNYKQHFAGGNNFSYDLTHIGDYFNAYLSLMDYWQKMLPGKVFTVQYENMVANTESQIKALLNHCGLNFEPQCLKFYENKRSVRTPSSEQVRQPIYKTSTQLWHHFEDFLAPLKESLGTDTLERFAEWL